MFQKRAEEFQRLCCVESPEVSRVMRQGRRHQFVTATGLLLVLGACFSNYVVSGCQALRNALVLSPWPLHEPRSISLAMSPQFLMSAVCPMGARRTQLRLRHEEGQARLRGIVVQYKYNFQCSSQTLEPSVLRVSYVLQRPLLWRGHGKHWSRTG